MATSVSKKTMQKVAELTRARLSSREIQVELNLSLGSVQLARRKARESGLIPDHEPFIEYDSEFNIIPDPPAVTDNCMIVGDVHLPTTNWELAYRVYQLANKQDIRTLIIAGDLMNMDALSIYENMYPHGALELEYEAASALLEYWSEVFDRIIMIVGNHEKRLFKQLHKLGLGDEEFKRKIASNVSNFEFYRIGYINVQHGDEVFRVTHPSNYSRIKGRTADTLAQKFQCNIISHHEHHVALQRDSYNRYTIINNGGLHEAKKMVYMNEFDNTFPNINQGFSMLKDGTVYLFTPYNTITNWENWGLEPLEG